MATELQIREHLATMQSLPLHLEKLRSSVGSVRWPGQMTRYHFPSGMGLTTAQRAEAESRLNQVQEIITGENLPEATRAKARLSLLTAMRLAYPAAGNMDERTAAASAAFYEEALRDMPPWAIDAAIKRWARGDVPDLKMGALNFSFAPAPAVLRAICKLELRPFDEQAAKLRFLLSTVSFEDAMGIKSPTSQAAE